MTVTFGQWLRDEGYGDPSAMTVAERNELFPQYQIAIQALPDRPSTYGETFNDVVVAPVTSAARSAVDAVTGTFRVAKTVAVVALLIGGAVVAAYVYSSFKGK